MSRARSFSKLINKDNYATYRGSDSVTDISAVSLPQGTLGFRNKIINGNFDIWQRGDNFSSSSVNEWSADRFRTEGYSLSSTISRQTFIANQTDVPQYPRYYCRVATSSAVSAGQYWAFQQRIEAPQNISYGTYTLSFWIRCTTGSLDAGAFKYGFGSFNEWSSSPALSTTWTKLTHTHTISSFDASDYVSIYLIYLTNSSPSSLSVDIAQVQVEEGSVPTPFEHRPYGVELALCQRYFQSIQLTGLFVFPYSAVDALLYTPLFVPLRSHSSLSLSKTARVIRITTPNTLDYHIDGGGVFNGSGDWASTLTLYGKPQRDGGSSNLAIVIRKSGNASFPDQEPLLMTGIVNSTQNDFDSNGGYLNVESEL